MLGGQGLGNTVLTRQDLGKWVSTVCPVLNPKQVSVPPAAYFIDACSLGKSMPHILYILTVTFSELHSTATAVSRFKQGYLEHIGSNALIHTKSNWESPKSIWECLGSTGAQSQPFSLNPLIHHLRSYSPVTDFGTMFQGALCLRSGHNLI